MGRLPAGYGQLIRSHQRRLERLVQKRGALTIKKIYEQAIDDLVRKLSRQAGRGAATFTTATRRSLLMQLRSGMITLTQKLTGELGDASLQAQTEAIRSLSRSVAILERKYTGAAISLPVEEASRFAGVLGESRTSLLAAHETSVARYGARLITKMESDLGQSLLTGETSNDAIGRILARADVEWYQAERIVRTELAYAYNSSAADTVADAAKDVTPDIMSRWNEHVSDSGVPMDSRVGVDSIAMHGQLAGPGELFTQPPSTKSGRAVHRSLVGDRWPHPPNRPNDRSVLSPWRPHWGVPGWVWRGGRRVPIGER